MMDLLDAVNDTWWPNTTTLWTNSTPLWLNATPATRAETPRHLSMLGQIVITVSYVVGVVGNVTALTILCRGRKKRNRKHSLMLRCLASNDLVALLGMLLLMNLQLYLPPATTRQRWFCMIRTVWKLFGLGSGSVAIVMAVERWLALTHPFLYQKHVTYYVIRRAIFGLWAVIVVLVCLPFIGFGIYYDAETQSCVRYRTATEPKDIAYAYLFFTFGTLLSVCIVWCNVAVIRVLCKLDCSGKQSRVGRRISRNSSNRSRNMMTTAKGDIAYNSCTQEEMAFARLMAVLCFFIVICWMPQMITIVIAQVAPDSPSSKPFFRVADVLLAMHFTLDPFIFVILSGQRRPCVSAFMKLLCRSCRANAASTPATSTAMSHDAVDVIPMGDVPGVPERGCDVISMPGTGGDVGRAV